MNLFYGAQGAEQEPAETLRDEIEVQMARPLLVEEIKEINRKIFPVVYENEFYDNLFKQNNRTYLLRRNYPGRLDPRAAYIGVLSLRIIDASSSKKMLEEDAAIPCRSCLGAGQDRKANALYVVLLGLVEEERRKGLGGILMEKAGEVSEKESIRHILLHVQASNMTAIQFYNKNGFKVLKLERDYYCNVFPRDALLLRKCILKTPPQRPSESERLRVG